MRAAARKAAAAAMIGLGLGIVPACDTVKAPPEGRADQLSTANYPRIVAVEGLSEHLAFSKPMVNTASPDQPMKVTVPVRSVYDGYPLQIQYRFEFFNGAGQSLGDSGWRFEHLEPRVQKQLAAAAMKTQAEDWRLTVRPAR